MRAFISSSKCNTVPNEKRDPADTIGFNLRQEKGSPGMLYRQISFAERYTLGLLRQRGLTAAAIARVLGRHRSTIGREVSARAAATDTRAQVSH